MSGELRFTSSPASQEYRDGWERTFGSPAVSSSDTASAGTPTPVDEVPAPQPLGPYGRTCPVCGADRWESCRARGLPIPFVHYKRTQAI